MKIHHYSKALSWITRPRVTETATAETYTPELERMNFRPFTGKVGGLVEPGVTHYGKKGGFEKGNVWYKQNIGKYKTDIVRLRKLRQTLDNLEKGSTLSVNELHKNTGVSRKTIDNILMKEYKGKFDIPGMGKAQSLNIQKLNLQKLAQPVDIPTPFPKSDLVKWPNEEIKNKYVRDLKTKYTFPSGSMLPEPAKVSNAALAKKYFGKVNQATIGRVERINNILSRDLKLTYPKAAKESTSLRRYGRVIESQKYLSAAEKEILKKQTTQKKVLNKYFKNNPEKVFTNKKLKELIDVKLKNGKLDFTPRYDNLKKYEELAKRGSLFDEFDISPIRGEKRNIQYPVNKNISPGKFNQGFIKQVDSYFKKTAGSTNSEVIANKKAIHEFLKSKGYTVEIMGEGRIGAKVLPAIDSATGRLPNIENTLKQLDLPQLVPTSEVISKQKITKGTYQPTLYTGAAVAEELINHPLAGKAGKLARTLGLEFEAVFIALDFMNNLGKGIEPGESLQRSLQTASFGLYKGGDRKLMENVKKAAEELGFDPEVMGSLMKINERGYKQQKELARDANLIAKYTEYAENNPDQADKAYKAIEELKERRKKDYETWNKGTDVLVKEYFTNLQRSKKTMNITDEDINQSVINLQKSALSKVEKERIAKAKEKSTQVDIEAGPIGDIIQNAIGGLYTYPKYAYDVVNPLSPLPKWGGWKTEGMKEKELIEDMQKRGGPGELYRHNIARGYDIDKPLTARAVESEIAEKPFFGWKAEGGRVPFGKGKLVDEGRRAFMKWIAGITGATVAAGTGILKWGKVAGKGKTIVKAGDHIIQGTPGMPDWFIPLVNRVVKEGDDVSKKLATVDREIVHTKKLGEGKFADEVTVYQDMNTGNVRVEFESIHNMGEAPIQLEYRAGQVVEEGKHAGKKSKSEFDAVESEPVGRSQGPDDYSIEWDGENVVGKVDDLTSDTSKLKQFATKRKLTHKDKIIAKKKQKAVQEVHKNESDYIVKKQGEADWDDYLPDIDDID